MHPNAHMSELAISVALVMTLVTHARTAGSFLRTSGETKSAEPTNDLFLFSVSWDSRPRIFALPKSVILIRKLASRRILLISLDHCNATHFSGFRSRWMISRSCMNSIVSMSCAA
jgi:hypothetical protein